MLISGNCGMGYDTVIGDYSSLLWGSNFSEYKKISKFCFIGIGIKLIQRTNISRNIIVN